jgi:hypothetical protein
MIINRYYVRHSLNEESNRSTPKLIDDQVFTELQEQWKSN